MKKLILLITFIFFTFTGHSQLNSPKQVKTLKYFSAKKRLHRSSKNKLAHKYVRHNKRGYIRDPKVNKVTRKILKSELN